MSLNEIDDIDIGIIEMLQEDPSITHGEIATKLERSQPAIGARIKKLEKSGLLVAQYGVDFNRIKDMKLVIIQLTAINPQEILSLAKVNPYIINILKISGKSNIIVFMACSSLKRIDYVVDKYFRKSPNVSNIRMEMITGFSRKFVLPVNFKIEEFDGMYSEVPPRNNKDSPNLQTPKEAEKIKEHIENRS